ncbi:MAG TPA: hypothetical protein VLX91_09445 [Candidatus Acidoferrales bacterium]|nr:hypothetical protein [Candidatus Acidoferrales bacterium]
MLKRILFLTVLASSAVYAQPYYYYFKHNSAYDVPGYSGDIYRLDLMTNSSELFVKDAGRVNGPIFHNSDQSRIFFQVRFSLATVDVSDPSLQIKYALNGINEVNEIKDSPKTNRYYITIDDMQDSTRTIVVDRQMVEPIDTIYEDYTSYNSFLSQDGKSLYRLQDDSTGIFFSEYIIDSKQQMKPQRVGNIGPFVAAVLSDSRSGYALVSYVYNLDTNLTSLEYTICNVNTREIIASIKFPWNSNGYLVPAENCIVLAKLISDRSQAGGEYHTGDISVFDVHAGTLLQRLKLPPEGKILLFDNYPNMVYYYFEKKQTSINIDLTKLPTIGTINTQNVLVGSGAFTLSVTGRNFTTTSKVRLNGTNRATTFVSDTLLQATIRAGDVDTATTVYIAVRDSIAPSSHATTDSVALNIISVPQQSLQPILDCVTQINDTTYTAWFGYENDDTTSIFVPVGPQNEFSPTPNERTQPIVFAPGRKDKIFSVTFNGKNLTWKLNGNEVVASKKSPRCN